MISNSWKSTSSMYQIDDKNDLKIRVKMEKKKLRQCCRSWKFLGLCMNRAMGEFQNTKCIWDINWYFFETLFLGQRICNFINWQCPEATVTTIRKTAFQNGAFWNAPFAMFREIFWISHGHTLKFRKFDEVLTKTDFFFVPLTLTAGHFWTSGT